MAKPLQELFYLKLELPHEGKEIIRLFSLLDSQPKDSFTYQDKIS